MSKQLRRAALAATTAVVLGIVVGCSTTTGGTAAVGTDFTPTSSSAATTTSTTATTTRSSRPTTSSESTTSSSETATTTVRPTDTAGAPMPSSIDDLQVGACYVVGEENLVTAIDCAELHDGQVFQIDVDLPGVATDESDVQVLFDAATPVCSPEFERFTGSALDSEASDFDLAIISSTAPGSRTVVSCAVVDKTGAQWAGTAEKVSGSYAGIVVGDCFDYPTATTDALKLACEQPHDAEMYLLDAPLGLDAADAPYPTDTQWQDLSTTICVGPFTDFTGLPFDASTTLSFSYVYPLVDDWSDVSKRTMSCVVIEEDGTKLVGSKRA